MDADDVDKAQVAAWQANARISLKGDIVDGALGDFAVVQEIHLTL